MTDLLAQIVARKRQEVAEARARIPLEIIRALAEQGAEAARSFEHSVRSRIAAGQAAVIAEIKKASPSKGLIRAHFDPAGIARAYEQAGAACISVLTDECFFQGCSEDLQAARAACNLPVLRKDFLVDPYQVYQARVMGADCILLIAACLDDGLMREMEEIAHGLGMAVVPEVHERAELERALALRTSFIGINNRDLRTFEVAITVTERMLPHVPAGKIVVAESGIASRADAERLRLSGVHAFLVGEALLKCHDPGRGLRAIFGSSRPTLGV